MTYGTGFQPPLEPPPTYGVKDWDCFRCSRPRIYVVMEHPYDRLKFDCAVNEYAPYVRGCPAFNREPGVD